MQTFIRIENSLEKAMYYRNGATMQFYSFKGVHLLPNEAAPYVQTTIAPDGIELEDVTVTVMSMCGTELQDITDYFYIVDVFQDLNGANQVVWGLTNVPYDFGNTEIYLQILQGANDYFYTTPFVLSSDDSQYVSRWHYKDEANDIMQSIGLNMYYRQDADEFEIVSYDTISTGMRRTVNSKLLKHEVWRTGVIDYKLLRLFKEMVGSYYVYCDYQRCGLFQAFETPRLVGDENFTQVDEILLVRNGNDVYDPFALPTPQPPPPSPYQIILNSVTSPSINAVVFDFSVSGFTPTYLSMERSEDGVTWTPNPGSPTSPRNIFVANAQSQNYFYSVYYEPLDVRSNIEQLATPSITIDNITSPDTFFKNTGNKYNIFYTVVGFQPNILMSYEVSTNGTTWVQAYFTVPQTNPMPITAPSSSVQFKYFRIRYPQLGITSPTYNFEF